MPLCVTIFAYSHRCSVPPCASQFLLIHTGRSVPPCASRFLLICPECTEHRRGCHRGRDLHHLSSFDLLCCSLNKYMKWPVLLSIYLCVARHDEKWQNILFHYKSIGGSFNQLLAKLFSNQTDPSLTSWAPQARSEASDLYPSRSVHVPTIPFRPGRTRPIN